MLRGTSNAARFVVATVLIDAISFGIVMPVLPTIVMRLGHVDLPHATRIGGWLAMTYAAVQFLMGPLIGNLGDRVGRRPVILGCLLGFAIDYSVIGFAPNLIWLFVGRGLAGIFGASFGPAGAALADLSRPEERARYFGMMGAAFGIGFVLGPAIGGLLGEIGPRAPFYAAGLIALANFLFGLFAFPETLAPANRRGFSLRRANPLGALLSLRRLQGVLPVCFASFWWNVAVLVYPTIWSYWAMAALGWTPGIIGASLAAVGLLMALSQFFLVGRVVGAIGERRAAILGMVAAMVQFAVYAQARNGWMVLAGLWLMPLQSLVMPSLGGMSSRRVPADAQGELQGFSGSIAAIAAILAPAFYSPTLAYFTGPAAPMRFVGAPFVVAIAAGVVAVATLLVIGRAPAQIPSATAA